MNGRCGSTSPFSPERSRWSSVAPALCNRGPGRVPLINGRGRMRQEQTRVLVTGAGGFIGHHLVNSLKARGYWVRGVDLKEPEFESTRADEFLLLDLRRWENCQRAAAGMVEVYNLAANMG